MNPSFILEIGAAKIIANGEKEAENVSRLKTLYYIININVLHESIFFTFLQHPTDDTRYMTEKFALANFL